MAGDTALQALNRRFRGVERPTDVLSWSYGEGAAGTGKEEAPWGEMALSVERAAAQALENGWPLRTEVLRLLAHGCAHLAGYDHDTAPGERVMKALEVKMLAAVGLRDLYPPDGSPREGA
jgi:probable rRNA maturation factor